MDKYKKLYKLYEEKMFYSKHGKRLFDLTLTIPGLVVLSPLLAFIALMVRAKLGSPVLFRQVRPGLGGRPFTIYKFRTMTDARGMDGELLADGERLTRFGRFLRSISLYHLSALWNRIIAPLVREIGWRAITWSFSNVARICWSGTCESPEGSAGRRRCSFIPSRTMGYWDAGLPVLAATDRHTDLNENMLKKYNAGLWAETGNLDQYEARFMELYTDPALRKSMGENGRKAVETDFSLDSAVNRFLHQIH